MTQVFGQAKVGGSTGLGKDYQSQSSVRLFNPHVEDEGNDLTAKFRWRAPNSEAPKAVTFNPWGSPMVIVVGWWCVRKEFTNKLH